MTQRPDSDQSNLPEIVSALYHRCRRVRAGHAAILLGEMSYVTLLIDSIRHNDWANRTLVEFCLGLPREELAWTASGTYGNVADTLRHLVRAEGWYRSLISGEAPDWRIDEATPIEQLGPALADMATYWAEFLRNPFDSDRVIQAPDEQGRREVRVGVILAQVFEHGSQHRGHVGTILGSHGRETPSTDAWAYGRAVGRNVRA